MQLTWLDSNSWLWEWAGLRILVDPWLVGDLVFGGAPWLFRGYRPQPRPLPEALDLILLSQGLPDHAHPETLGALPRSIPVVASAGGATVAHNLGYTEVSTLRPGETIRLGGVTVTAIPGAPIGPTTLENGYLLREIATGVSLFYEPHGFHPPDLSQQGPVDVVITPMATLTLPLLGPILRGQAAALELAAALTPRVMLPTAQDGEILYSGWLLSLLKGQGGSEGIRQALAQRGQGTQVLDPQVGVPLCPLAIPTA